MLDTIPTQAPVQALVQQAESTAHMAATHPGVNGGSSQPGASAAPALQSVWAQVP